jgi:hypothetical protein
MRVLKTASLIVAAAQAAQEQGPIGCVRCDVCFVRLTGPCHECV